MSLACWRVHDGEGVPGAGQVRGEWWERNMGEGPEVRAQKTSSATVGLCGLGFSLMGRFVSRSAQDLERDRAEGVLFFFCSDRK